MRDLYLRFEDESDWTRLAFEPDAELAVDVVGIIRKPIQQWTDDGEQVTRRLRGFHVNVRCMDDDRDLAALVPFEIHPEFPSRVWF
jgi:hypothetical protein